MKELFTMWENEEDGGVQMLGCISIEKKELKEKECNENHPSEAAVQKRSCSALITSSTSDRKREVQLFLQCKLI
eukprot:15357340-Ditylum_brightwellii.AAC.1